MADYLLSFDPGIINMSYCLVEIKTNTIIRWGLFSIKDNTNEGSCTRLAKQLDDLKLLVIPNWTSETRPRVIIVHELQPRCNVKTLVISGQLIMYFVLEKFGMEITSQTAVIQKVVGFAAKNKLKYYEFLEGDAPLCVDHLKKGHYRNKQLSKQHCDRILRRTNSPWLKFFQDNKAKQDDIADAFLQCLAYIKNNKLISGLEANHL